MIDHDSDRTVSALIPAAARGRIGRRRFLQGAAALGGAAALAACGSNSGSSPGSGSSDAMGVFGWANYDNPTVLAQFTKDTGIHFNLDVFSSNEEAIAKLSAAKGTAGYDLYMPTGVYIPQQADAGILQPLDVTRLSNFKNLDAKHIDQPFDRGNKYSVCKDWGSTGFLYDTTVIKRDLKTWDDFVDAMQNEASKKTSIIDAPNELAGLYAWRNATGVDWTSKDPAFLDAVEKFTLDEIAPHIAAYDSYPGSALAQGKFALMMCWNGDARLGMTTVSDPGRYRWVLGAPNTELWMDNWAIPAGAPNPDIAYTWINWILDPDHAYADMEYHGYNPGIKGIAERAEKNNLPFRDMIVFNDAQVASMHVGELNDGTERLVQILTKAKAVSGG
jgi:spermidine/putrescine transport system substrate-binding protein